MKPAPGDVSAESAPERLTKIAALLPPLAWTVVIGWFSTDRWGAPSTRPRISSVLAHLLPWLSPEAIEALHWLARKGGHVTEYGILAALWAMALGGWRGPLALSVVTAFLDELHQATTVTREGSAADLLLDSSAAAAALVLARAGLGRTLDGLVGALLWAAAVGGALLLAIDVAAGAAAGWLWLSAPAAWIALVVRRRRRTS
jgi:VanZ family protein